MAGGECKERNWRTSPFCVTVLLPNQATKEVRREWPDDTGGKEEKEAETKGPQCEGGAVMLVYRFHSEQQCKAPTADFYPQD